MNTWPKGDASGHSERLPRDRKCRDETLDHRPSFVGDRYLRRNPQAKVVGDKKMGNKNLYKIEKRPQNRDQRRKLV